MSPTSRAQFQATLPCAPETIDNRVGDRYPNNHNKVELMESRTKPKYGAFLSASSPKPMELLLAERENGKTKPKSKEGGAGFNSEPREAGPNITQANNKGKHTDGQQKMGTKEQLIAARKGSQSEQGQDGMDEDHPNLIDLTDEPVQNLVSQDQIGKALMLCLTRMDKFINAGTFNSNSEVNNRGKDKVWEQGGSSQGGALVNLKNPNPNFTVVFPDDDGPGQQFALTPRLDQATERELILTWNERCSVKRDRGERDDLVAVEEELLRRKKNKKEEWYDADGNLLSVTVSTMYGTPSYMVDQWGDLTPPTP